MKVLLRPTVVGSSCFLGVPSIIFFLLAARVDTTVAAKATSWSWGRTLVGQSKRFVLLPNSVLLSPSVGDDDSNTPFTIKSLSREDEKRRARKGSKADDSGSSDKKRKKVKKKKVKTGTSNDGEGSSSASSAHTIASILTGEETAKTTNNDRDITELDSSEQGKQSGLGGFMERIRNRRFTQQTTAGGKEIEEDNDNNSHKRETEMTPVEEISALSDANTVTKDEEAGEVNTANATATFITSRNLRKKKKRRKNVTSGRERETGETPLAATFSWERNEEDSNVDTPFTENFVMKSGTSTRWSPEASMPTDNSPAPTCFDDETTTKRKKLRKLKSAHEEEAGGEQSTTDELSMHARQNGTFPDVITDEENVLTATPDKEEAATLASDTTSLSTTKTGGTISESAALTIHDASSSVNSETGHLLQKHPLRRKHRRVKKMRRNSITDDEHEHAKVSQDVDDDIDNGSYIANLSPPAIVNYEVLAASSSTTSEAIIDAHEQSEPHTIDHAGQTEVQSGEILGSQKETPHHDESVEEGEANEAETRDEDESITAESDGENETAGEEVATPFAHLEAKGTADDADDNENDKTIPDTPLTESTNVTPDAEVSRFVDHQPQLDTEETSMLAEDTAISEATTGTRPTTISGDEREELKAEREEEQHQITDSSQSDAEKSDQIKDDSTMTSSSPHLSSAATTTTSSEAETDQKRILDESSGESQVGEEEESSSEDGHEKVEKKQEDEEAHAVEEEENAEDDEEEKAQDDEGSSSEEEESSSEEDEETVEEKQEEKEDKYVEKEESAEDDEAPSDKGSRISASVTTATTNGAERATGATTEPAADDASSGSESSSSDDERSDDNQADGETSEAETEEEENDAEATAPDEYTEEQLAVNQLNDIEKPPSPTEEETRRLSVIGESVSGQQEYDDGREVISTVDEDEKEETNTQQGGVLSDNPGQFNKEKGVNVAAGATSQDESTIESTIQHQHQTPSGELVDEQKDEIAIILPRNTTNEDEEATPTADGEGAETEQGSESEATRTPKKRKRRRKLHPTAADDKTALACNDSFVRSISPATSEGGEGNRDTADSNLTYVADAISHLAPPPSSPEFVTKKKQIKKKRKTPATAKEKEVHVEEGMTPQLIDKGNKLSEPSSTKRMTRKKKQGVSSSTMQYAKSSSQSKNNKKDDEHFTISCVTWNLAEVSPSVEDASFLKELGRQSDIVFLSAQECENIKPRRTEGQRSREWRRLCTKHLGRDFVPLAFHSLGGIQASLFVRRQTLLRKIQDVQLADVACGIGNTFHNKGAIGAFVTLTASSSSSGNTQASTSTRKRKSAQSSSASMTRLLFVSAHMAAHVKNVEGRNADFWRIATELEAQAPLAFLSQKRRKRASRLDDDEHSDGSASASISEHPDTFHFFEELDHVFFCGDLNYRVALPREVAEHLVTLAKSNEPFSSSNRHSNSCKTNNDKKWSYQYLLRHDQLLAQMAHQKAFVGFREAPITFAPTFKFDKDVAPARYDTSAKQRVPAWTDRILFQSKKVSNKASGNGVEVIRYDSIQGPNHSDHKPVVATFRCRLR
jgi:hypothetical protein